VYHSLTQTLVKFLVQKNGGRKKNDKNNSRTREEISHTQQYLLWSTIMVGCRCYRLLHFSASPASPTSTAAASASPAPAVAAQRRQWQWRQRLRQRSGVSGSAGAGEAEAAAVEVGEAGEAEKWRRR
jgi:hypothetical protein